MLFNNAASAWIRQRCRCRVVEANLQAADVIVAVDAEAHRPMVQDRFPAWENRIRF